MRRVGTTGTCEQDKHRGRPDDTDMRVLSEPDNNREGIHKLPYSCRVYSDGCGSMNHVASMASMLSIDHQFIPPHQQSLNEVEKVADSTWADARAATIHHKAPNAWFMYSPLHRPCTKMRAPEPLEPI